MTLPPLIDIFLDDYDAAVYDFSDRAKLRVGGTDRQRYLQGQLTNDLRRITADEALYACVLTAKGRLCADVYLHAPVGQEAFLLDADAGLREGLAARLERYAISDDVTFTDVTDSLGLLHLCGGGDVQRDSFNAWRSRLGPDIHLAVADRLGRPGVDFLAPTEALPGLRALLSEDFRLLPPAAAESWRIAAGVPRWGVDLDENTLPPEAGLEVRAISYDKGCYVGQETISRLKSIGHVNRHLRRLRTPAAGKLVPGGRLHERTADGLPGREIGHVTSATPEIIPLPPISEWPHGRTVALGYVRHGHEAEGTRLLAVDPADEAAAPREVEVVGPPYAPAA